MSSFERGTLRWARIAAFLSLMAVLFVCLQWYEMHTGSADTHELALAAKAQSEQAQAQTQKMSESLNKTERLITATAILAKQVKRTADVSSQNLEFTQSSTRLDQRAWVGVSDIKTVVPLEVGKDFAVNLVFKNTGRTPAKNVRVSAVADPVDRNEKPDYSNVAADSRGLFPPGAEMFVTLAPTRGRGLTEQGYQKVMSGDLVIYFHGQVDYEDIFQIRHKLTFCFHLLPAGAYGVCGDHNETD